MNNVKQIRLIELHRLNSTAPQNLNDGLTLLVYKSCHLVDPESDIDGLCDIYVQQGKVVLLTEAGESTSTQIKYDLKYEIDCQGLYMMPSIVDLKYHCSSYSFANLESIYNSAIRAGVGALVLLPGAKVQIDKDLYNLEQFAKEYQDVSLYSYAALSKAMQGDAIAEYASLNRQNVIALCDGKRAPKNNNSYLQMMQYAKDFDLTISSYPLEKDLSRLNSANENIVASWLGITTSPVEAEILAVHRDILLAQKIGVKLNIACLSSEASCELVRNSKKNNAGLSACTSIFHLCFNENDLGNYDLRFQMTPPLRSEDDRFALISAVIDGTIDAIISDCDNNCSEYATEPFGQYLPPNYGLELLLPLGLRLVNNEIIPLKSLVYALSTGPAKIAGIEDRYGSIKVGKPANFLILDINEAQIYHGFPVEGKIKSAMFNGKIKSYT